MVQIEKKGYISPILKRWSAAMALPLKLDAIEDLPRTPEWTKPLLEAALSIAG